MSCIPSIIAQSSLEPAPNKKFPIGPAEDRNSSRAFAALVAYSATSAAVPVGNCLGIRRVIMTFSFIYSPKPALLN